MKQIIQIIQWTAQEKLAINKIVLNDTEVTDQTSIAKAFNDYFADIGNDLASAIPSVDKTAYECMPPPSQGSFPYSPLPQNVNYLEK